MTTKTKNKKKTLAKKKPPATLDLLQRYTVDEATAYLRQSRAKTYQDIRAKLLPIIKDGSRTYIHGTAIADRSRGA